MKKIKHWTLLTAAMLLLSVMIIGCGKKSETSSSTASSESSGTSVTILTPVPKSPETPAESTESASPAEESAGSTAESIPEEPEITVDETGNAQEGQTSTADAVYSVVTGTGAITGQDDATYEMMYQITYPYISLSDEDKERYPALQAALDAKNQAFANSAAESESWYADAAAQSKEIDGEYFTMLYSEEELSVVRADARALSAVGFYSNYGGGAHGMYGYYGYNFDPETGNEIGIRDVVKDIPALLATIRTRVEAEYPGLSMMSADYTLTEENAENLQFAIGYQSLNFYFEPYLLASYAEGAQIIQIPFKGNENLLNEKYFEAPDHYGVDFVGGVAYEDLNGDGVPEKLETKVSTDPENGAIQQVGLSINGNSFMDEEEEFLGYSYLPTLVKVGQNLYLYVELMEENDFRYFRIYNLTGGQFSQCDESYFHFARSWMNTDDIQSRATLSNPDMVKMETRTDVLGTGSAYSWFYVGQDGRLVNYNEGYFLEHHEYSVLTLKQDLSVITIEPNRKYGQGKEATLKAGSKVTGYFTDNETYVELRDEDGDCYWVSGQFEEWPLTVGGIPMDDLFDGIMYAG